MYLLWDKETVYRVINGTVLQTENTEWMEVREGAGIQHIYTHTHIYKQYICILRHWGTIEKLGFILKCDSIFLFLYGVNSPKIEVSHCFLCVKLTK